MISIIVGPNYFIRYISLFIYEKLNLKLYIICLHWFQRYMRKLALNELRKINKWQSVTKFTVNLTKIIVTAQFSQSKEIRN